SAAQFAAQALLVAGELGASTAIAAATATASWIDVLVGDLGAAEQRRAETAEQFAALTDGELATFPVSVAALVRTTWLLDRPQESAELAARGLVITRGSSWPLLVVQFLAAQAMAELAAGRVRTAGDVANSAVEAASLLDNDATRYWSLLVRSLALEPTSALQPAQDAAERAVEESKHGLGSSALAGLAWARALLAADLPGRALEVIAQTHGGAHLPLQFAARRAESHAMIASAHLHRGELAAAREAADRARAAANQTKLPASAAHADGAAAQCALAEGDPASAVQLAASASEHARQAGQDLAAARFDMLRGQALTACGDRDAAAVALRSCEATFATGGADRLQAEATRLLRQAGRRVTRSGRGAGPANADHQPSEPLTARQQEIAELAAAGRTNREIAEALFLSLKTVETHLSSVYVKLGVSSRKQLTERWTSRGDSLADSA
ncbi:MAG: helix-turn-helix transcriptional regulator, partial [Solirubrobacteraceae bacterium]|nr:helix-turn-helix transcriptional regulator [Solirubrobacteraceae bacterium]